MTQEETHDEIPGEDEDEGTSESGQGDDDFEKDEE